MAWKNGDTIAVGGGAWSRDESGEDYWDRSIKWTAEPRDACKIGKVASFGGIPTASTR